MYPLVQTIFSIPALEQVLVVADGILRNFAVTRVGIEGVASNPLLGDDKWVAKLICGTLAGCGGGFWIGKGGKRAPVFLLTLLFLDTFKLTQEHWTFSTPRFLHSPTIDMKASFASTLFYLVATNPDLCSLIGVPSLTQTEAQAWSAMILSSGLIYKSYINKLNNNNQFNKDVPSATTTTTGQSNEKKDN
jgi:hypothetical protein